MYDFKPPYFGVAYYPEAWPREQIDEVIKTKFGVGYIVE